MSIDARLLALRGYRRDLAIERAAMLIADAGMDPREADRRALESVGVDTSADGPAGQHASVPNE